MFKSINRLFVSNQLFDSWAVPHKEVMSHYTYVHTIRTYNKYLPIAIPIA